MVYLPLYPKVDKTGVVSAHSSTKPRWNHGLAWDAHHSSAVLHTFVGHLHGDTRTMCYTSQYRRSAK